MFRIVSTIVIIAAALVAAENPCTDIQYLALKKKPLDSMSQREYEYFSIRDKACVEKYFANKLLTTAVKCTLDIQVGAFTGDPSNRFVPEIYVDDTRYGLSPQTIVLDADEHTISLIPSSQITFEKDKWHTSAKRMIQLNSMVITHTFEGNRRYSVQFIFQCKSRKCNTDDEWQYLVNVAETGQKH